MRVPFIRFVPSSGRDDGAGTRSSGRCRLALAGCLFFRGMCDSLRIIMPSQSAFFDPRTPLALAVPVVNRRFSAVIAIRAVWSLGARHWGLYSTGVCVCGCVCGRRTRSTRCYSARLALLCVGYRR